MSLITLRGRPAITLTDDGRKRVTRTYDVLSEATILANLESECFVALGTADVEFTDCLLIAQSVSLDPNGIRQLLTRIYEEIPTNEASTGDQTVQLGVENRFRVTQQFIQSSDSAFVSAGILSDTIVYNTKTCVLTAESVSENPFFRSITRVYEEIPDTEQATEGETVRLDENGRYSVTRRYFQSSSVAFVSAGIRTATIVYNTKTCLLIEESISQSLHHRVISRLYMEVGALRELGRPNVSPINFDQTKRIITRHYEVIQAVAANENLTDANAYLIAYDTADAEFTSAYLVDQRITGQTLGKTILVTRVYSEIPGKFEEKRRVSFTFPAIDLTGVALNLKTISAVSGNVLTAAGHGFIVGDTVSYELQYVIVVTGFALITTRNGVSQVTNVSGNDVTLNAVNSISTYYSGSSGVTYSSGKVWLTNSARQQPLTEVVTAHVSKEYFLPGVSSGIATTTDLEAKIGQRVRFYASDGTYTNILGPLTSPTAAQYLGWIQAKTLLTAESYIERWRGNIYALVNVEIAAV